jgi:hypothetical protein
MVAEQTPKRFSYSKREELSWLASEDADHGQYNDSESDVADHRSPQLGCAATQRTYSWKMAILGF